MHDRQRGALWAFRIVFFLTAVACIYVLGGGLWFFGGWTLGWLWAVLEMAVLPSPVRRAPDRNRDSLPEVDDLV